MLRFATHACTLGAILALAACKPAPQPGGGGQLQTACPLARDQTTQDLRGTCTATGSPANRLINPVSGDSICRRESLAMFDQGISASATFIYGENGDDTPGRVRVGIQVADGATHRGSLVKTAGADCASQTGPVAAIATDFAGRHVAIIDKERIPHCVFRSRFTRSNFAQTLTLGLPVDPSVATEQATVDEIERTLDLEAALAVNAFFGHQLAIDDGFRGRAGRCENDWAPFTGN
jgi:hypothetical protein